MAERRLIVGDLVGFIVLTPCSALISRVFADDPWTMSLNSCERQIAALSALRQSG
jgi:hypothetical protein